MVVVMVVIMVVVVSFQFLPMEALVHNFEPIYIIHMVWTLSQLVNGEACVGMQMIRTRAGRSEWWVGCWDLGLSGGLLDPARTEPYLQGTVCIVAGRADSSVGGR